ncbi:bifunctional nicotinamide-nucleotide adenylyltransferase/Nudix hydroxylase [Comamonas sp. Y33R10-2]|uniref:bifunctional nicotinamide-nucleotide adenylyltransferase/Nudix hydroxylase n=1 Tax=Comamonas sp. Y33R10-2 TaxID=2853257 RepID=UPI001C5CC193|nr:bifunctional nicotinamide-nucleotide adenylyltransferase/Nudix hydroxylase [Comamonas sp. Y33R10-2]QXZ09844.1 bifunctional nicotinamide-nucleotide adenylyltransferase/Nudix hydroxylase [Comamonas sp. Y33R10-2]
MPQASSYTASKHITSASPETLPTSMPLHTAVLIGRFQPLHNGHMALLHAALQRARQVVVVLGSAWQAPNPKNPFSWQERAQMLRNALSKEDAARVQCVPVRDYYNEPLWVNAVRSAVQAHVPEGASVALVGHFKDSSSSYLARFPGWELISLPRLGQFDATPLRDILFGEDSASAEALSATLGKLSTQMPQSTLRFLQHWAQTPEYVRLQKEWHMLKSYKEAWAKAPYPPMFVTVDALLRCHAKGQDHVLLIQRGHAPGVGQWALPGGFLEQRDSLWQSCLRELREETCSTISEADLLAALQAVQVFDHPDRSLRGRTITHVHYLDLGMQPALPPVQGADDAALARWVPIANLAQMEASFFEDHFKILCQFLPISLLHGEQPARQLA